MRKATLASYQARIQRVLADIDREIDDDLDLDRLASVAAFSKFHFHRQFVASVGVTPHRYVQLARMKRASYRLAFREDASITDIAMDAGYEAPDAFARAFKGRAGQIPSAFRKSPDWDSWLVTLGPLSHARSKFMTAFSVDDVTICDVPTTPVAVMRHRGDPTHIGETIQRFIAWRKATGLVPQVSATFAVFYDDPRTTPPVDFRLDLCAATDRIVEPNDQGVEAGLIRGGRCATLRVVGMSDDLEPAALFLYRDWLPGSGEDPRDFPLYCQRITFYPDVAEHQAVTDLYLPLK
jgi:AraC family transcriptional regulator